MVVNGDDFIDAFAEALRRTYILNRTEKGDSWLSMDMPDLYQKLLEEVEEAHRLSSGPDELRDVGLVSAMIWWRELGHKTKYVPPPR